MFEILSPVQGTILNHYHGIEKSDSLEIEVMGLARVTDQVTVNGIEAKRNNEIFTARIPLTEHRNTITAVAEGSRGRSTREIQVLWDKNSFKRVNFCMDDNILFLIDVALKRPGSLFDHFYLKKLKEFHEKYGLKLVLNLFQSHHNPSFLLGDFPTTYRKEWEENADWLKLAFHARAEFPDRIYQNAEPQEVLRDFDEFYREVRRFAGEDSITLPQNIHWSMVKPESLPGLRERGVKFLTGMFLNARTRLGEEGGTTLSCDTGYFENQENSLMIERNQVWHDFHYDITFGLESIICNLDPVPELEKKLDALLKTDCDTFHMLSHEQYSFPSYHYYLPDHFDRIETMCRKVREAGFQFVNFNDGFLGNPSWEK